MASVGFAPLKTVENRTIGILWMLLTMLCFIGLDSIMKYLLASYSLVQVTWARFFFATVIALLASAHNFRAIIHTRALGLQTLRSLFLMLTTGLFNAGIKTVPLATATTIMFFSPILVTVLSIPLLREHVGLRRWIGVAVGFVGAVIVVQPGSADLGWGALLLLLAALLNANYQIITRKVREYDSPMTSVVYTASAGALVTSLIVPWYWDWPDLSGWLLFISAGAAGGIGHLCLIQALRHAPASVVAPFSYSSLIWATLAGWIIFAEWPTQWTWLGGALIIGSGLYIFHRERTHHPEDNRERSHPIEIEASRSGP